jgi:L-ascorbate metabolism protein UlaG (beta-lactamase superfamily)
MIKKLSLLALLFVAFTSCKNNSEETPETDTETTDIAATTDPADKSMSTPKITPIAHATFVMEWDGMVFYVDPTGGAQAFEGFPAADYVLVTDVHGDHMSQETLDAVVTENSIVVMPKAVQEKLTGYDAATVINNGETKTMDAVTISAIPMYNLTEGRLDKHVKGRGNGYVIEINDYRVYISGDTEDIPEMRSLENIDAALVCMNLPYTMDLNQAADAVLEFQPKKVIPYHYRGTDGFQDVNLFKSKVQSANPDIEVALMEWYPSK